MRAVSNLYDRFDAAMDSTEVSLQTATNQLSSGRRVNAPSDDPLAFAQDVTSLARSSTLDSYTKNADAVLSQAQLADSALANVSALLTQAISLGTEGGGSGVSSTQRQTIVGQVQGIVTSVIGQANTTANGVALFAGTASVTSPFVADPSASDGVQYLGNDQSNSTPVGDTQQITVNLPGSAIFTSSGSNVFGALQQLVNALGTGSSESLSSAISAVSTAVASIGQSRAIYGGVVNQLNVQTNDLSRETVSLSAQQTNLIGVDTATAVTNLTQAQTAHTAILAMAAKVLPESLLNYLH